jgi:GT2 family glycosyltransferase
MNGDWRVFGINRECVEAVGFFDENFHPCYCEDADYEYRCTLAGVPWSFIPGGATHEGSAAIRSEARYAAGNARSYPENRAYYEAKWGGPLRGGERYASPFDQGGPVSEWDLRLSRLRLLAW